MFCCVQKLNVYICAVLTLIADVLSSHSVSMCMCVFSLTLQQLSSLWQDWQQRQDSYLHIYLLTTQQWTEQSDWSLLQFIFFWYLLPSCQKFWLSAV